MTIHDGTTWREGGGVMAWAEGYSANGHYNIQINDITIK